MRNNKGQNVIEYTLLVMAVVLVFLVILNPQSGPVKKTVETTLNSTEQQITNVSSQIKF